MQRLINLIERIDQKLTKIIDLLSRQDEDLQTCVWLDNHDVWRILKVSESTLRRRRLEGRIPFTRIGGKYYYKESDIQALFKGGWGEGGL